MVVVEGVTLTFPDTAPPVEKFPPEELEELMQAQVSFTVLPFRTTMSVPVPPLPVWSETENGGVHSPTI